MTKHISNSTQIFVYYLIIINKFKKTNVNYNQKYNMTVVYIILFYNLNNYYQKIIHYNLF